jgi:hypothetical protein
MNNMLTGDDLLLQHNPTMHGREVLLSTVAVLVPFALPPDQRWDEQMQLHHKWPRHLWSDEGVPVGDPRPQLSVLGSPVEPSTRELDPIVSRL